MGPAQSMYSAIAPPTVLAPEAASAPRLQSAAEPRHAVALEGLTKIYVGDRRTPPKVALDGIDLVIPRGSIFGLLGPNGAGKSTLINILAGLVVKTAGRARIWDIDIDENPRQARAAIGVVPQELNIDAFFTPRELLELQAGFYGVPRAERRTQEVLAMVGLADQADSYARTLSGGMRRRLLVAKAMVHSPPVLVLDEPTAGVDVELRQQLWTQIRALNHAGTTVLLTTHYLEEAESLCDRIAIIDKGRVVVCDTTEALVNQVDDKTLRLTLVEPITSLPPALQRWGLAVTAPGRLLFRYGPSRTTLGPLFSAIAASGLTIRDATTEETDLEDVFLRLTGPNARTS
jgi:ABC-2 type transport system ATP-binding protein